MQSLLKETAQNIRIIRDMVETGKLQDEKKYPLSTFRNEQGIISDLINDLNNCAKNFDIM